MIELLVTVLVIGVLAAIAIPVFIGQQESAQDSAAQSDLQHARIAMKSYSSNHDGAVTGDSSRLVDLGWVNSPGVSLSIHPGTGNGEFCIDGESAVHHAFMVSDSRGVAAGSC